MGSGLSNLFFISMLDLFSVFIDILEAKIKFCNFF